ncbi:MAG: hypothetical protein ACREEE_14820 [Dongiaceae bacterium]
MRSLLLIVGAALAITGAGSAWADQPLDKWLEQFTIEGLDDLEREFERFIERLPRFEAPYVDENGNIVIPRKPDEDGAPRRPPEIPDGFDGVWT